MFYLRIDKFSVKKISFGAATAPVNQIYLYD